MPPQNKKLFNFKILILLRIMIMRLILNVILGWITVLLFFETYFNPNRSLLIFFLNWPPIRV